MLGSLSAICGLTDNLEQLIPTRIVLGLCGAILVTLSQAAMLDIYPREKHVLGFSLYDARSRTSCVSRSTT